MLCVTLDGRVAHQPSIVLGRYDGICRPIVEAPNGLICHLLRLESHLGDDYEVEEFCPTTTPCRMIAIRTDLEICQS